MLGLFLGSVLWCASLGSEFQTSEKAVEGMERIRYQLQEGIGQLEFQFRNGFYYGMMLNSGGAAVPTGYYIAKNNAGRWEYVGTGWTADGGPDWGSIVLRSSSPGAMGNWMGGGAWDDALLEQVFGAGLLGGSAPPTFSPDASGEAFYGSVAESRDAGAGVVKNASGMGRAIKRLVDALCEKISPFIGPVIGLALLFVVVWSWVEHVRRALGLKRLDAERARNGGLTDAEKKKALAGVEGLEQKELVRDFQREEMTRRRQAREQAEYLGHAKVDAWLGDDDFWHDPDGKEKTRDVQAAGWFQTGFREELV